MVGGKGKNCVGWDGVVGRDGGEIAGVREDGVGWVEARLDVIK